MNDSVTLILILHNRHRNIDRLLEYYQEVSFQIIIADSSKEKYVLKRNAHSIKHLYTPALTFTQKVEQTLEQINTPYVVMCADDDFIIPESIIASVQFLENNQDFAIAQGTCINYKKASLSSAKVEFGLIYPYISYDILNEDALSRLEKMFENYRSVLYAVHRTNVLRLAFKNTGAVIKNLYLNEYLTAVVPIIGGKYKELDILYQIREYAEDSDDKMTDNLDKIFLMPEYAYERNTFIQILTENSSAILPHVDRNYLKERITNIFEQFSNSHTIKNIKTIRFKKKIGFIIQHTPFIGKWLIIANRNIERREALKKLIKTKEDQIALTAIEKILKKSAPEK